jgi:hypothetical protein
MNAKMAHFRDRWNQKAGQKWRLLPDFGHFDMELTDELQRDELRLYGTDPFPSHIATPLIPDHLLESFGTARSLDIDLPGVERMRSMHAECSAPDAEEGDGAVSALLELSSEQPGGEAQLNAEIAATAAANTASARSSIATRRVAAGVWLAEQQRNITNVKPVTTSEEVSLYTDLLLKRGFLPAAGSKRSVNWVALCEAFNTAVYETISGCEQDCSACGPLAGVRSSAVSCAACRRSCGLWLKTPELLKDYYDVLGKRLAAAAAMEPNLPQWQTVQREHNRPPGGQRFPAPLAPPPAPPPAAADAVHGALLTLLPQHEGEAMEGLEAPPPKREKARETLARWRNAAILELRSGAALADVQAAAVRTVMERMCAAEASSVQLSERPKHTAALRKYLERLRDE